MIVPRGLSPDFECQAALNTSVLTMCAQKSDLSVGETVYTEDDVNFRLQLLALRFQDEDLHRLFVPGEKWLACSIRKRTLDGAVTLANAIGIPDDVFHSMYMSKLKKNVESAQFPCNFFRVRDYNGCMYITANLPINGLITEMMRTSRLIMIPL